MGAEDSSPSEPGVSTLRRAAAGMLRATGVTRAALAITRRRNNQPHIRAINYHQTLRRNASNFEHQLQHYHSLHDPVGYDDLAGLLDKGEWRHTRPGLLISFDDGARSNYEIAAPLLEKYGWRGWFFVPAALIECPAAGQRAFASDHNMLGVILDDVEPGGRAAMSWEELRDLRQRGHVVGCHTMNHRELRTDLSEDELRQEIVESRTLMEERLGAKVDSFCWVGGSEAAYSAAAAKVIAASGYRFSFMTNGGLITAATNPLQLDRTNVEDRFPVSIAAMNTSGLIDKRYREKRARVHALTAVTDRR